MQWSSFLCWFFYAEGNLKSAASSDDIKERDDFLTINNKIITYWGIYLCYYKNMNIGLHSKKICIPEYQLLKTTFYKRKILRGKFWHSCALPDNKHFSESLLTDFWYTYSNK